MPKRIQRRRTKGWRMPENCVYVGRPTKWGNPFSGPDSARNVADFRVWVEARLKSGLGYPIRELRGKDLACFCPLDRPCHSDVLLELANA